MSIHRFSIANGTVYPFGEINGLGTFAAESLIVESCRFFRMGIVIDAQTDHVLFGVYNGRKQTYFLHGNAVHELCVFLQFAHFFFSHGSDEFRHIHQTAAQIVHGNHFLSVFLQNANCFVTTLHICQYLHCICLLLLSLFFLL